MTNYSRSGDISLVKRSPSPRRPQRHQPSPERDMGRIALFVRERRKAAGLTQRALAELAGVGPRAVWDFERGKATLRMDVANRVLAVFGKRLDLADAPRPPEPTP